MFIHILIKQLKLVLKSPQKGAFMSYDACFIDRQTNSLTPYSGSVDFLFKLNLLPPYWLRLQGDNIANFTEYKNLKQDINLRTEPYQTK